MEVFNQEKQLVDAFTTKSNDFLESLLKKSATPSFLIHEFNSNHGIADVVLGTMKRSCVSEKREAINPNWVIPLSNLKHGESITIWDFCKIYRFSETTARKCFREYERAGFLRKIETSTFQVTKEYIPGIDVVVSVEAKLKDWKRALFQAQRYKRFSDLSFVLLDGSQSATALKNIAVFQEKNIGLMCLSESEVEIHFIPQRNTNKVSEYYLRLSELAYGYFTATQSY